MRCGGGGGGRVVVSEDVSVYQLLITDKNNTTIPLYCKSVVSDVYSVSYCTGCDELFVIPFIARFRAMLTVLVKYIMYM
jgi:hypothetical protein